MTHYDAEIDMSNPNLSHTQVIDAVGHDKRVLDVGCATGYLARELGNRGCAVSGVEVDTEAAEEARPYLDRVVVADLDNSRLTEHFEAGSFDVVIFADVLEHLVDPAAVLADATSLLAPGGKVVLSVPNVAHGSLRLALLQGRWAYTDTGLLDRTHIRFYTYATLLELVEGAGLTVEVIRSTVADPLSGAVNIDADQIPPSIIEWVRSQPHAMDFQFIVSARVTDPGAPSAVPGAATPALPIEMVRIHDRYTDRSLAEAESRHKVLTIRDHVVGLEARAAKAELAVALSEASAQESRKSAEMMRAEVDRVAEDREQIKRSMTWRVGRVLTAGPRLLSRRSKDEER